MSVFDKTDISENLYEFYRTLGAIHKKERTFAFGAEYVDCEPYNWPRTFFDVPEIALLGDLTEKIKQGELPAYWILLRPENYQEVHLGLEEAGFRKMMTWPGMGLNLNEQNFGQQDADNIRQINTEEELKAWVQVVNEVLFSRTPIEYYFFETCWRAGFFKFYAAFTDGVLSSTAMTFARDAELGIYMVATSAAHRRQGLAERITLQILKDAKTAGIQNAYLQASRLGAHVYHKLGFQSFCNFDIYWLLGCK